ncbi:MAG: hypothetical protein JWL95_479 [Gemmatimonadetes bacterium]|nr:hypothetical protein [Gemmatimonadota bacterium]
MNRIGVLALLTLVVIGSMPPRALSAQRAEAAQRFSLSARPLLVLPADSNTSRYAVRMTSIAPPTRAAEEGKSSALGAAARAVVGVGAGALIGGWLGYFGAQVGRSDWDKLPTSEKTANRQNFTIIGVGLGGVLGYIARPRPHAPSRLPQPFNIPARTGRQLLATAELRRSIATNALEAVELGRPEWLKKQQEDAAKQGATPRTGPVESTSLVVYVGEEKVGGIETLRDISIPEVIELRLYDAREAKRRWGVDHRYGAIEVVPVGTATASSVDATATPTAAPSR